MTDDINTALETVREALKFGEDMGIFGTRQQNQPSSKGAAALDALSTIETTLQEQEAALFGHHAELTRLRAERDGVEKAHEELDAEFAEVCAERDEAVAALREIAGTGKPRCAIMREDRNGPDQQGDCIQVGATFRCHPCIARDALARLSTPKDPTDG